MYYILLFQNQTPVPLWGGRELDKDKASVLANYQAMMDTIVYPPIFLPTPADDMLVHMQVSKLQYIVVTS